ncbi:PREDICTED: WAT1-related protein At5g07050-like [Prunus mume]|uniref:WAT1-related protein At5g07050-like n=1 Tax=Prunus mume TaxID=102107 RepID=A0ABM1LVT6_PRUMU|nr:PREDICTED: WAT1-related protein At5g07050-like [Prunus mume]
MNVLYKMAAGHGGLYNQANMDGTLERLFLRPIWARAEAGSFIVAMLNLVPVITFILAVIFRLEKLSLQTTTGKVKIIGIVIGIGGAMVFNLYRGKEINMWSTHVDLLHTHGEPHAASHKSPQGKSDKEFPLSLLKHSSNVPDGINSICNFCLLRGEGLEAMEVGLALILMTWGVKKEGQFFASVFQPVLLVMVALAGSSLLDEKLHMGSILGGLLIVVGLYAILWASSKDKSNSQPTAAEEMSIHSSIAHAEIDDGDSPSL